MTTKIHKNPKQNVMTFYKFVQKRYESHIETYGFDHHFPLVLPSLFGAINGLNILAFKVSRLGSPRPQTVTEVDVEPSKVK